MSFLYGFLRFLVMIFVYLLFPVKTYGKENIEKNKGYVLCCNHTSISDIIFLGITCNRQINFMAKKELFEKPFLRGLCKALGAFPVDRKSSDKSAIKNALNVCNQNKILGIFPEGTRHRDGLAPKKAKPGAAMIALSCGADIIPVSIYRSKAKLHIFQKVTVRYGKPLEYSEYAKEFDNPMSKTALKSVSELIMSNIITLWEKKH